ncbi:hypothetical protein HDV01_006374 [Terramyces sp. JEL0728]|nr:hypothetical protein HDV01_006374 [Terramyces sp. JEL0728]
MSEYNLKKSASFEEIYDSKLENHPPLIKSASDSELLVLKKMPPNAIKQTTSYPAVLYSESNPKEIPKVDEWIEDTEDSEIESDTDDIIDMINDEDAEYQFRKAGDRRLRGVVDENAAILFRNLASRFGDIGADVVFKNILRKSYLGERKQRTYDYSKAKAPELPKTPPPVKIRRPVYQTITESRLLKKVLKVKPAFLRARNEHAMTVRSATPKPEKKKGPYYLEPFEAASPPVHLPPALSDGIDIQDSFLLEENVETIPPKFHEIDHDEFLKLSRHHQHPSLLYQPKAENPQPIAKSFPNRCNILTITDDLEREAKIEPTNGTFSRAALPQTKRDVVGVSNPHVMSAVNPYFVSQFSTLDSHPDDTHQKLKARSETKMLKSNNPMISSVVIADPVNITPVKLPPLKLHTENALLAVIGGVRSRSDKINAAQTRLRSLFKGYDKSRK